MLTVDFNRLNIEPGSRVLDLGCGPGRHSWEAYRSPDVDVVAADITYNIVAWALIMLRSMVDNRESGGGDAYGAAVDASRLPFADNSFDYVICSEVLEHIPDDQSAVAEMARVLKPEGTLVVSVPLYLPEKICWALADETYRRMAGGHVRIYKKKELEQIFGEAGLKCQARRRAHALHSPLWWLRCIAVRRGKPGLLSAGYDKFIHWHVTKRPAPTVFAENLLAPVMAKSIVYYLKNEGKNDA
ncbi:Ubiquinone/menaquinone biosynthesis C-methylase UbiE [Desulfatibacillum alkenivorans DSM 16219]|uniref:Ubiquinone/menaquinone biosynthesis C-methylase UbiE n=1 Tax=Desulfatibacillum alkenivorans DSM 16219 TaxID=1121393 RepID=A0A1M6QBY5_9BACT|nr:class I SAM-dependent methyltransferase [Desulfatibacillum alkenivorans]SHK17676.1 Ubiquinone/menaquinone biosynthesis C-methylase UbiE [Desulfatibacillum alkenivorans DSM 16219]